MQHNPRVTDTDRPSDPHGNDAGAQIRTFLIADVRGYTLFTQERGDEAAAKLAAKFADIAREIVEGRGGMLLELRGDEALCVFASTREAIRTAVDLQQRFVEETLEQPELPLTVGIGLDAGEAVPVQGGYRGAALNLAARLCGQARAGEILATREVTHLARRIEDARYVDHGSLTFKGIADPVVVVRVVPEGEDPAVRLRPYAPAPPAPPTRPSRRWVAVGAVAAVLALVAISIPLLSSGDGDEVDIGTNSVARLNAEDGALEKATELGQRPGASAVGFGSLWVAQPDRGVVARLDLETGSITDPSIRVGNAPSGVAIGEGSVWVTNAGDGTVSRINVQTNEVSQTIPAGSGPTGVAFGDGALWIADSIASALLRVDPDSEEVTTVPLAGLPSSVTYTPQGVWVSVTPNSIARVDPRGPNVVLTQQVGSGPTAIVGAFGSIWVANQLDDTVTRLDPSTGGEEATIPVDEGPNALVAAGGSLWVAHEFDDTIRAIHPDTNQVEDTVPSGGAAASLASGGGGLWLAVGASATEHRGGTLTMSSAGEAPISLDPAVAYDNVVWQIHAITNDTLVTYKKVGGPDGATLVPDLASALPQVSADGLSYRLPLREGIRYSTGELVRPEDFRHGLERSISLSPDAAGAFGALKGAKACRSNPACDLSDSIVVDDEAITFHLARPDPDLPFKLALQFATPVPVATPFVDQDLNPVPATGPYMIEEASADRIELVRNPEFREWSGAAQPDGFVDAISWRFNEALGSAFDRLREGTLDLMSEEPSPEDLEMLMAAHPDQALTSFRPVTLFVGFDVRQPPFEDLRVRQALNYAIDRDRMVELLGDATSQRPTCQILPPNFHGYEPFCPYTLEPESGVWSAPDLDRARALIEDAGVSGEPVTAWVMARDALIPDPPGVMQHVVDVLNDLGLRARLKVVKDVEAYFDAVYQATAQAGTPAHPQIYLSGWAPDYPFASNFIDPQFACGGPGNPSGYCSRSVDAEMNRARQLQATDPGAATRAWTQIEHRLVEEAAQAPLTNPVTTYAVSARTENVQINPQWGILLSRVWVQ
jgi:peptide/nickel transport system substrate-binding protein